MKNYTIDYTCDWCRETIQVNGGQVPKDWKELSVSNLDDLSGGNHPEYHDLCPSCYRDLRALKRKKRDQGLDKL